jgi:acyl-coenzyme A synthetase/AMP-(fatty) acid ligase
MARRPGGRSSKAGAAPAFNLAAHCLGRNLRTRPQQPAVVFIDADTRQEASTFVAFGERMRRLSAALSALGLARGDRVLLRLPTGPDAALSFFAAIAAGLVPVTCSTMLTRRELGQLAAETDALLLLQAEPPRGAEGGPALPELILDPTELQKRAGKQDPAPIAATAPEDPAFLIFTSGTGGQPKGVLHAQRSVLGRRPMRLGWQGFGPGDRVMHAGQLNWTYTLGVGLMDPWAAGATALLYTGPHDPARWPELIATHEVTVFAAVPTVFRQILKYGRAELLRRAPLRHCLTAGEALSPELLAAWREATGKPLYESLGMSEISTYVSSGPATPVRPGSPGRPQPGRRVAVLPAEGGATPLPPGQTGLLAVHRSDPGLMLGYWRQPEATEAAMRGAWFTGGDLAEIDRNGYVWFHGREDDVLNCQGYRVSAIEVERTMASHPAIAEVAVGESRRADGVALMTAYVVPAVERPDQREILAWTAGRLAAYKCPKLIRLVPALPRTPNGKVMRKRLEEAARSALTDRARQA